MTPDSFSDGGHFFDLPASLAHAARMLEEGADVIDVGGESTRPNALPVDSVEEAGRILPVITALVREFPSVVISVDTTKADVARAALDAGAQIINDVSGFRLDPRMPKVCADAGCQVILMHSRGTVSEMALYTHASYPSGVLREVSAELLTQVRIALEAGIVASNIILDPGIGFSKTSEQSIEILRNLSELISLWNGFPAFVGLSRKRFLGDLSGVSSAADRDNITAAANVVAYAEGARWFRVHDVVRNRQALDLAAKLFKTA